MICSNCHREIAEYSNFCYFCGARQTGGSPAAAATKRLMRSATDCRIAGVCAGFAEFMGTDPTIVRLLWAVITVLTGILPGVVVYLLCWLIMPVAAIPLAAPQAAPMQKSQTA